MNGRGETPTASAFLVLNKGEFHQSRAATLEASQPTGWPQPVGGRVRQLGAPAY